MLSNMAVLYRSLILPKIENPPHDSFFMLLKEDLMYDKSYLSGKKPCKKDFRHDFLISPCMLSVIMSNLQFQHFAEKFFYYTRLYFSASEIITYGRRTLLLLLRLLLALKVATYHATIRALPFLPSSSHFSLSLRALLFFPFLILLSTRSPLYTLKLPTSPFTLPPLIFAVWELWLI